MDAVADRWRARGAEIVAPRAATSEQLLRVHAPDHVRRMAEMAGKSAALDPDTYTSPESHEIALLAAGAVVDAVERVMAAPNVAAAALVRPPGHHAERDRAMGFCLFNNVAVAAAHARALGANKVAIVDYDVHHGNGTQHIFEDDPHVLYVSTHQYPYYPGTGAADEIGRGRGARVHGEPAARSRRGRRGLPDGVRERRGAGRASVRARSRDRLRRLRRARARSARRHAGHHAGVRCDDEGVEGAWPNECCGGRIVAVVEGGYDLQALAGSLDAAIDALNGAPAPWPTSGIVSPRGREAVSAAKAALSGFWTFAE